MRRRGAPVLVEGGLRFVFPIAGLTYDDMFRLYVLQKEKKYETLIELSANSSKEIVRVLGPEQQCL
jgi:hypothetical protein